MSLSTNYSIYFKPLNTSLVQTPPQILQACPSTSTVPTSSLLSDPISSQPTHFEGSSVIRCYARCESSHFWFVVAIGMYRCKLT